MGGLGNQLFQLAFALSLAHENSLVLEDWMGNTRKNQNGQPQLCGLKLPKGIEVRVYSHASLLIRRIINLGLRVTSRYRRRKIVPRFYEVIASGVLRLARGPSPIKFSRGLGFDPSFQASQLNSHACGYFQTYKYASQPRVFEKLEALVPVSRKNADSLNHQVSDAIMLHVRLTDYLENSSFGLPGIRYYELSIRHLIGLLGRRSIHVYSDDPDLALSRLPIEFSDLYLLQSKNDEVCETLDQMRGYSGYIIANSSLSWWAAFLRYNAGAPVVCPDPWFHSLESPAQLIPDSWEPLPAFFDTH